MYIGMELGNSRIMDSTYGLIDGLVIWFIGIIGIWRIWIMEINWINLSQVYGGHLSYN